MADIDKIKRNVGRMVEQNAPEADIDEYIRGEGTTLDQIRAHKVGATAAPRTVGGIIAKHSQGATPEQQEEINRGFARRDTGAFGIDPRSGDLTSRIMDGATLGFKDEIFAGVAAPFRAAGNAIRGKEPNLGGEYDQQLRINRIRRDIDKNAYDGASGVAADLVGGVLSLPARGIAAIAAAGPVVKETFGQAVRRMQVPLAVTGAKFGAANAYGEADGSSDPNAGIADHIASRAGHVPKGAATGAAGALVLGNTVAAALKLRDMRRDRAMGRAESNQARADEARSVGITDPLPAIVADSGPMNMATRVAGAGIGGNSVGARAKQNIDELTTGISNTLARPLEGKTAGDLAQAVQDDLRTAVVGRSKSSDDIAAMPKADLEANVGKVTEGGFYPPPPRVDPVQVRNVDDVAPRDIGPGPQRPAARDDVITLKEQVEAKARDIEAATAEHNHIAASAAEVQNKHGPLIKQFEALQRTADDLAYQRQSLTPPQPPELPPLLNNATPQQRQAAADAHAEAMAAYNRDGKAYQARLNALGYTHYPTVVARRQEIAEAHSKALRDIEAMKGDVEIAQRSIANYGDGSSRVSRIRQMHAEREALAQQYAEAQGRKLSDDVHYDKATADYSAARSRAQAEAAQETARLREQARAEAEQATAMARIAAEERHRQQVNEHGGFKIGTSKESYPTELSMAYELAAREAPQVPYRPIRDGSRGEQTQTHKLLSSMADEARSSLAIKGQFDGNPYQEGAGLAPPFYNWLRSRVGDDIAGRVDHIAARRNGGSTPLDTMGMKKLLADIRRVEDDIQASRWTAQPMSQDKATLRRLRGALAEDFHAHMRTTGDIAEFRTGTASYKMLPGEANGPKGTQRVGDDAASEATYFMTPENLQRFSRDPVQPDRKYLNPADKPIEHQADPSRGNVVGRRDAINRDWDDKSRIVKYSRDPEVGLVPVEVSNHSLNVKYGTPIEARGQREGERASDMFRNADRETAAFYNEIRKPLAKLFGDNVNSMQAMETITKAARTGDTSILIPFMRVMNDKTTPTKGASSVISHMTGGGKDLRVFMDEWAALPNASRNVLFNNAPSRRLEQELNRYVAVGQRLDQFVNASKQNLPINPGRVGHMVTVAAAAANWHVVAALTAGNAITARVLSSPRLVRWLTKMPDAARGGWEKPGFVNHMAALGAMANRPGPDQETAKVLKATFGEMTGKRSTQMYRAGESRPVNDSSMRPLLESFSQMPMNYGPGDRESTNVEDRRGQPEPAPEFISATDDFTPRSDADAESLRSQIVRSMRIPARERSKDLADWLDRAVPALQSWESQGSKRRTREGVRRGFDQMPTLNLSAR